MKAPHRTSLLALFVFAVVGCNRSPDEPGKSASAPATTSEPAGANTGAPAGANAGATNTDMAGAPSSTMSMAPPEGPAPIPAPEDVAAPPASAKKTASGLAYKSLKAGTGKVHPSPEDKVSVHYTGWTTDGKMFDSSVQRGQPTSFRVNGVIKGWTEGLQLMVAGDKMRFWIPANLAYGDKPGRPGTPTGMLVFDVELLDVTAAPKPPEVPADVKAPPASAKKTASGLAYRVLEKGKGTKHPQPTDRVTVHYTGWTNDGKMFDSSVMRGEPTSFGLNGVIKGWTEGVQLMVEGEKTRFWIPGDLAYGDKPSRPGVPSGMLVFDIQLLAIQ